MADELAKVLTIPDSVTQKMDDVIEKINEIESASNKMATTVNQAWKQLANGDIDAYLKKLQDVADATQSKKISIDATDITKAASEAERWATAMAEVATQASNYAASKTATFAVQQEWNEALKALKSYEEAKFKALEQGTTVSPQTEASHNALVQRLEELRAMYPNLARAKDAAWDATQEKLYIQHLERIEKKNQQIEDKEERQAHSRELRAKQIEAANTRILILAEKLSREEGKSQHYAGLIAELQRLQEEYKKLGNSKEDAERRGQLEKEMEQVRISIQSADGAMRRLSNTTRGLFNYSAQLGRAFALLFSVSQIRGYIRQIREVTAEFELQRVALGSLLQSQEKANELFGQITNFAVRSPFTIKELNTYTKQLAAYNIQYENLFDTTKMLADVSAGLGVDIGRLILAFGQVKAATVLRGTEVRQITESGFGILGELAKYYTELEGKLVSVGDVQDRITKKMVKFADVEEIFKRVTSAGGMFYNMQEKMANTLYGKWSNLTDRIDLMLNEIGQSNKGVFNLLIDATAVLAENWEIVAVALQVALPLFAQFMISTKMASVGMTSFDRTIRIARVGLHSFGKALKTAFGPVSIAIIAIEALIEGIDYLNERQEAAVKRAEDFNRKMSVISKASAEYKEIAKAEKTANETDAQFAKRMYDEKVKSLESFRSELAEIGIEASKLPSTELLTEDQVDQEFALLQERARAWAMFGRQLNQIIGGQATGVEWGGILGDNLKTDAQELNQSYQLLNDTLLLNVNNIKNSLMALRDVVGESRVDEILKDLTQKPDDDFVKYIERVHKTLNGLLILGENGKVRLDSTLGIKGSEGRNLLNNIKETGSAIRTFMSDLTSIDKEAEKSVSRLVEKFYKGSKDELKAQAEKNPIPFRAQLDTADAEAGITDFAKTYFDKRYYFHATIEVDTPKEGQANEWWKDVLPKVESFGVSAETLKSYQDLSSYVGFLAEQLEAAEAQNKKFEETTADANGAYAQATAQIIEDNNKTIAQNEAIAAALGVNLRIKEQETRPDKTRNDYLKESVSLIKKMGDEYEKALDYMGEKSATTDISTRYSSLLSDLASKAGLDGSAFVADLTFNPAGVIEALKEVADAAAKAGATEAEQTAREAIATLEGDKFKLQAEVDIDALESSIDDALARYNMGKELSKLGLGKELTESLFNFKFVDLNDAKRTLEEWRKEHTDANGQMGKEYAEAYMKAQKEVTNAERKELEERIKNYHKYLKQSMSDAVAVKLEEARQLSEIDKMQIEESAKAQLRAGVRREASEKYDKAKWEEFKDSDMYIQLFEDLDNMSTATLARLKNRLIEIRDSLNDLPPEALKEIQSRFEKIDELIRQRSPFKQLAKDLKEVRELRKAGETRDSLEYDLAIAEEEANYAQQEVEFLQKYINLKQNALSLESLSANEKQKAQQYDVLGVAAAEADLEYLQQVVEYYKTIMGQKSAKITQWDDLDKDLEGVNTKMQLWGEMWDKVADVAKETLEMMGVESDSTAHTFIDMGTSLKDIGLSALQQAVNFKAMGIEANNALGVIGWVAIALETVVTIMSALFKLHDKRLEKQIKQELDSIDDLVKKYERLEEAIDAAYSSRDYNNNYRDAINNLDAQNAALRRAMAAEEDKKKTDAERIKEWEEQERENLKKIAQLRAEAIEAYGGFGTSDNIKSAAEDFVSAWLDAFNETGKGLDGLSDKMDEWLNNAIQRQLLMRLSDQYITPLLEQFDAMFSETSDQGRIMTKEEIDAWRRLYEENSKAFDDKAKAYLDALDIKPTGIESEMSGLQRGIEGVTETTAQALEALLNSMRFYVSDSNNLLRQFYMSFISADETMNPMLYELKQHTALLNAIHTLLNSTTKMTNNNGRALKVLMM